MFEECFDTEIMKKLREFQCWAEKFLLINKKHVLVSSRNNSSNSQFLINNFFINSWLWWLKYMIRDQGFFIVLYKDINFSLTPIF